ncbi:MAG: phosphatidate cytidylyltransferase [Clostridioides sp.]|jgi:phosphatidate cytidylyltransferase|nr:phosphatidate cytidylyltransferase [Clostridioides sp.]
MLTRIIASLVLIPLLIVLLFGGTPLYVVESILIGIALHEFYKAFEHKDIHPIFSIGYAFAFYIAVKNIFKLPVAYTYTAVFALFIIGILFILNSKKNVIDLSVSFLGIFYIGLLMDCVSLTMDNFQKGSIYVWIIFIIAFVTDIFAYFVGSAIGKHKLIPSISPKKTVEGCLGGVIGSTVVCLIFGYFFNIDMIVMFLLGSIGSVIAQFGDLFASSIKRYVGIKDYGKLIPGHGGVLDRFDSVIMVAPFIYNTIRIFLS